VGCAAGLQPYSLKTMKSLLNSRYSPLPAYVPEPDPDSSSDQADSSIVTPADEPRPAADAGVILRSAQRSRPSSGTSPMESRRLAAPNHAASEPLAVKSFAIKAPSGYTA